jgi:hypothetical protein
MSKPCVSTSMKARVNRPPRARHGPRVGRGGVAQRPTQGCRCCAEEAALLLEVAHRDVVAGDQEAHHLEHEGDMVLGLACGLVARQAQRGQVGAQLGQRLLVERSP